MLLEFYDVDTIDGGTVCFDISGEGGVIVLDQSGVRIGSFLTPDAARARMHRIIDQMREDGTLAEVTACQSGDA